MAELKVIFREPVLQQAAAEHHELEDPDEPLHALEVQLVVHDHLEKHRERV